MNKNSYILSLREKNFENFDNKAIGSLACFFISFLLSKFLRSFEVLNEVFKPKRLIKHAHREPQPRRYLMDIYILHWYLNVTTGILYTSYF
jgi:hypothetical protein